jgi:hypothetical protein
MSTFLPRKGKLLLFLLFLSLSFHFLPVLKAAPVPVASSHSNTNTGTNLNALTGTGNITFTVNYDLSGNIKWYKDGVLAETDSATTAGSFTTSWTSADYGKVKELKVNSTTADGTSSDTIWAVEVEEIGTASLSQGTSGGCDMMVVGSSGWSNLPSLYLHFKDNNLLQYVSAKSYNLKGGISVEGGTFYLTYATAKTIKMRGIPPVSAEP